MPINYRLDRLEVRNFRGLPTLDLILPEGIPTYLIGANNSGKSTVLNAIALAFRQAGFINPELAPFDFFHPQQGDPATEFTATVFFAADDVTLLPAVQGVGDPVPAHGTQSRGRINASGRPELKTFLVDAAGKSIALSPRTPLKESLKAAYADHPGLGFRKLYARPQDIAESVPDIWHLRPDNVYPSLYTWKTGPLMRLAKILSEKFFETEWAFSFKGKDSPMPQRMRAAHEFLLAAVAEFPFWKDELKPKFDSVLTSYLGRHAHIDLRPTIQKIEDWMAQQLALSFATDGGGAATPLSSMGDGWQSLVRLAALDVLRQMPDQRRERVVLLFEEPEAFLHPHLRRKLRSVLADLSSGGWTIICTTHAPEFISFQQDQQVVRMCRTGDQVTYGTLTTSGSPEEIKIQEKLDEHGTHEMFFANAVILCEGKDDEHALRLWLGKNNADLDGKSISVVGVGSVNNLPAYAETASALGIAWCAVLDEDRTSSGLNPATEAKRQELRTLASSADLVVDWPGSLEACLGIAVGSKALPAWQEQHLEVLDAAGIKQAHPQFAATCASVKKWATV